MSNYWRSAPIRRLKHPVEDSPIWGLLGSALWGLMALAIGAPFLLFLSVALPICFLLQWILKPDGASCTISPADRRWLGPNWRRSVLHAVLLLEPQPNIANIRNLITTKVLPLYPRLLSVPQGNYWHTDVKFNIERHVFNASYGMDLSERQLQEYVSRLLAEGLSNDKPPWELQILHRHAILRVHQSLTDGKHLVRVLCQALADCRINPVPYTSTSFLFQLINACILGPLSLLCWLFLTVQDCNVFTRKHVWTGRNCVAWSSSIALSQVTHIKLVTRSTANCVLLAALAGAVRSLLQGCGVAQPPNVHIVVPATIGHWTAPVTMTLPVGIEGAIPRLWKMRRTLEELRHSARPAIMYLTAMALLASVPSKAARLILSALTGKASLQFSSMKGPAGMLRVNGTSIVGVYPIHPAPPGIGLSVTAFVYSDRLFIAVVTDSSLEPAADLLLHHLHGQVIQMHQMLLHRRIPGESRAHLLLRRADVTGSPTRDLRLRLSTVQEQVTQELSVGLESDRIESLKMEFSHLLCELRRRKSLISDDQSAFEDDELVGALWRPQRRRALSCSTLRCPTRLAVPPARPASYIDPQTMPDHRPTTRPLSCSDSYSYFYSPTANRSNNLEETICPIIPPVMSVQSDITGINSVELFQNFTSPIKKKLILDKCASIFECPNAHNDQCTICIISEVDNSIAGPITASNGCDSSDYFDDRINNCDHSPRHLQCVVHEPNIRNVQGNVMTVESGEYSLHENLIVPAGGSVLSESECSQAQIVYSPMSTSTGRPGQSFRTGNDSPLPSTSKNPPDDELRHMTECTTELLPLNIHCEAINETERY